jgi:hypothetical protein
MPSHDGVDRRRTCVFGCQDSTSILWVVLGGGRSATMCERCAAQLARREYLYTSRRERSRTRRYLAVLRAE